MIGSAMGRTIAGMLTAALSGVALWAAPPSLAQDKQAGWIEIPTRISGVSLRIKPGGCKDNICTLEVGSSIPGDPITREAINCKTSQIQTLTAGNAGPWLRIDPGSVDEVKFHKVCHGG
jgi:hypothetical protein